MPKKLITVSKTDGNTTIQGPGFEYHNGRRLAVIGKDFISHEEFTDIDGVNHTVNGTYRSGELRVGNTLLWGYGVPNSEQPLPGETIPGYPPENPPIPDEQPGAGTVTEAGWLWIIAFILLVLILVR